MSCKVKVKKPMNAYMIFSKEKRAEIIQQKPELKSKVAEIAKNSWQEQKNEELEQKLKKIQQENEILTEKISEINKIFEEEKTELKNKIDDLNESIENAVEINSEEIWNENIVKVEIHNNPMYINYRNSQPSTSGYQPKSPQIERKV